MSSLYFSLNSTFLSSYRSQAALLAPIYWSNLLPVLFVAHCALRHAKQTTAYKESVFFPTFTQALATIPQAIHLSWFAISIGQDSPTTVLFCTFPKIVASSITIMSFSTITALAFSRFLKIVCMCKFGLRLTAIFSAIFASPLAVAVVLIHFDGFLYPRNDVCMPILFLKAAHLPPYYAYTFAVPSLAVALNLITVMHLIRYRTQKNVIKSVGSIANEFHIAASLLVQSTVPLITVGSRAVISLNATNPYGIVIPAEVVKILDVLGCFTVGLNASVAIISLKTFRRILIDLLPCAPVQNNIVTITATSVVTVS